MGNSNCISFCELCARFGWCYNVSGSFDACRCELHPGFDLQKVREVLRGLSTRFDYR